MYYNVLDWFFCVVTDVYKSKLCHESLDPLQGYLSRLVAQVIESEFTEEVAMRASGDKQGNTVVLLVVVVVLLCCVVYHDVNVYNNDDV